MIKWISTKEQRPKDGQKIVYYFEPFRSTFVGKYDKESDSVFSRAGFTTMEPEVPCWIDHDELVKSIPEHLKEWD